MVPSTYIRPALLLAAGLFGITGIAMAAAASHLDDSRLLGNASMMCLVHAPALVAIHAGYAHFRTAPAAGLLLAIGTLLFAGDLAMRHFHGTGLMPMAAPSGGILMMAGWLMVGAGFLFPRKAG